MHPYRIVFEAYLDRDGYNLTFIPMPFKNYRNNKLQILCDEIEANFKTTLIIVREDDMKLKF